MDTWKLNYLIVGGDIRQNKLHKQLFDEGFNVMGIGICNDFVQSKFKNLQIPVADYKDIIKTSDIVIGPIPCSKDKETIFSLSGEKIYIKNLFSSMRKGSIFIAGMISDEIRNEANGNKVQVFDFFKREEVAIMNAIPRVFYKKI